MEILVVLTLLAIGVQSLNIREQRARIGLLGSYLGKYRIEKLMEDLLQGYLRALGEADAERQEQIWRMLSLVEDDLCRQFNAFVLDFAKVDEASARASRLGVAMPYASTWLPAYTFDMRKLLGVHAHAIQQACSDAQASARDRAFVVTAELLLMQHSCHWFCRSRTIASARLLARHKTAYVQVMAAVAAPTRRAYCALVGV